MMPTAPTVFLDFDGTITTQDATDAILEAYADPAWMAIEDEWKAGRIGSRECLAAQVALIDARPDQVNALLDGLAVDPGFVSLLAVCASRGVPVHIVSDGFDYCIERILNRPALGLTSYLGGTRIVSSHLEADAGTWRASFVPAGSACTHGCATCKPAAMTRLKAAGSPAVFVGDGLSDRYAAAAADLVFAKHDLSTYCRAEAIRCTPFETLATVADDLDALLAGAGSSRTVSGRVFPAT
jgi:2-hydroxy-3-keto-5-methylthiopentenyl-1-phosphate phosphatase